jgi:putative ABC transport system substrate-binding protein
MLVVHDEPMSKPCCANDAAAVNLESWNYQRGKRPIGQKAVAYPFHRARLGRYYPSSKRLEAGMRRRQFIGLLGGSVVWPFSSRAQQAARLIAYFAPARTQHLVDAFNNGLRELSYVDGKTIKIQYWFADEKGQTLEVTAAQIVQSAPDAIVVVGVAAAAQAKRATTVIPVVFAPAGDPVMSGLVPSLGAPGSNLTGVSLYASELNAKRLEIFKEALPGLARVGILLNANNFSQAEYWKDARLAAEHIGLTARPVPAKGLDELETAFAATKGERLDGLVVLTDAEFDAGRETIVRLAAEFSLPAIYEHRAFVQTGGLISYGPNIDQLSYRAATYIDKILKGAKPADLPIEQPTRFELLVNLKTAKALGLTLSPTLLARADEVIE